jgi:hypothetical protein
LLRNPIRVSDGEDSASVILVNIATHATGHPRDPIRQGARALGALSPLAGKAVQAIAQVGAAAT